MVTYLGVSLFTLWLLPDIVIFLWKKWWCSGGGIRRSAEEVGRSRVAEDEDYQNVPSNDNDRPHPSDDSSQQQQPWNHAQHIRTAMWIAPVWFTANWTYNASLDYTSITSSTVLASTGSLFTFVFAVLSRDEMYSSWKMAGVVLGVGGCMVTALQDGESAIRWLLSSSSSASSVWGDVLGLLSAMGYGGYAIQTRVCCPHDESLYSMQRLLGYIGLCNLVVLSPIAVYVVWIDGSGRMEWTVCGMLVLKGLFDNVLSDYLWLRAVMLTNATVATVGLGLTIPLAFVSDVVLQTTDVLSVAQIVGALAVLMGFVLVNVGEQQSLDDRGAGEDRDGLTREYHGHHHHSSQEMIPSAGSSVYSDTVEDQEEPGVDSTAAVSMT